MDMLIKGANVYARGRISQADVLLLSGRVASVGARLAPDGAQVIDCHGKYLFPGFVDVHVHLREPGFSYKETISTGTRAAARGGYTEVCAMPNLRPVPDCLTNLRAQLELISADACVGVSPYGSITLNQRGEALSDMRALSEHVCAFSDDGRGVASESVMARAMDMAAGLNKLICAHCEDEALSGAGVAHAGAFARARGLPGISSESEWRHIERDIRLLRASDCAYHVCHVSTRQSVALIRRAKAEGLNITCETAPHYAALDDSVIEDAGRFKMNPPIRAGADREAIIEGLLDGTIDMIATDHAPHSESEKRGGMLSSLNGVSGLECAFAVMYTRLVKRGILSIEKLVSLFHDAPKARFGIGADIEPGARADMTLFDLDREYVINPAEFISMGKSTPFEGERVYGACDMTLYGGRVVWRANQSGEA